VRRAAAAGAFGIEQTQEMALQQSRYGRQRLVFALGQGLLERGVEHRELSATRTGRGKLHSQACSQAGERSLHILLQRRIALPIEGVIPWQFSALLRSGELL